MAVTFAVTTITGDKPTQSNGQHREVFANIAATGTYTDGGDSLLPSAFGLQVIIWFQAELNETVVTAGSGAGFLPRYDYTNKKLKFYKANGTTNILEASGATVTTAASNTFRARVVGY